MFLLKCLQAFDKIVQLCHHCPGHILNKLTKISRAKINAFRFQELVLHLKSSYSMQS